jgi:hypothetical protein
MNTLNNQDKKIKSIPYGISDYELIRNENYYYVDKTPFLKTLKESGRYLLFIRPRRFGKSLFVSMMESYFDIFLKDQFENLFKGTWIFDHPTEERNKYMVLTFNLSAVDPEIDKMEASFLSHVRGTILYFIHKYSVFFKNEMEYFIKTIKESQSSSDILSNLLMLCKGTPHKLYVIIDEYDNFANTTLSTAGKEAYQSLTHGPGFFRSFFNVLKGGTTGTGAPIGRSFITGVSPITMDDVTSGYNIGENVSMDASFNQMLGFNHQEVSEIIDYYQSVGLIKDDPEYLKSIMDQWYNGYLFSRYSNIQERLFNSDMVLYFLREYFKTQSIPLDLIDRNVRIDYGKLKHLIVSDQAHPRRPNGNFNKLKEIIENGGTTSEIEKGFPLEKLTDPKNFKSLLFYFGLLSIKNIEKDKLRLVIPNETAKYLCQDLLLLEQVG